MKGLEKELERARKKLFIDDGELVRLEIQKTIKECFVSGHRKVALLDVLYRLQLRKINAPPELVMSVAKGMGFKIVEKQEAE